MNDLEITETRDGERGRYAARLGEGGESELTYTQTGGRMVIDHTFTPPEERGKGVAARLVARAVADARARGWSIVPVCPYVEALIDRTPEWQDMLAS